MVIFYGYVSHNQRVTPNDTAVGAETAKNYFEDMKYPGLKVWNWGSSSTVPLASAKQTWRDSSGLVTS